MLSFSWPGIYEFMLLHDGVEGLPSEGREDCRILKIVYFLENYIGILDWK